MSNDYSTLYKLMVLYLLDLVDFPLTTSALSEIFGRRQYAPYFHLQQSINELAEDAFIRGNTNRNTTSYQLTDKGEEAIGLFRHRIPHGLRADMRAYLEEHHYSFRKESDLVADYYMDDQGEYIVKASIMEKKSILLELKINVASEAQARAVCDRWKQKHDEVYGLIVEKLFLEDGEEEGPEDPDYSSGISISSPRA